MPDKNGVQGNMFDFFYKDRKEVLAEFLGVDINSLQSWSDASFTLASDKIEYLVMNRKKNGFKEYLGEKDGYHIYKN